MIRFEGFAKRFGGHWAVKDLDLVVNRGEAVALLGPNGSGKTTSLKAAAGLLSPTAGTVRVGEPGAHAALPAARRELSYLPQRVAFPECLSGREVVEFYRQLRTLPASRTDDVLRLAALNGAGVRGVGTYSGGMVQRLGLAVALLPDAPILLLDEPTAALDPEGLAVFYELMEGRHRGGKTVLFTSHHLGDVERLADRFAVLVAGRLVAALTRSELHDRLSERGVLRLRLDQVRPELPATLAPLAPGAVWSGDELLVPGPAALRPAVVDAVRAAGATILGLSGEEGRLDDLYRDLVREATEGGPHA